MWIFQFPLIWYFEKKYFLWILYGDSTEIKIVKLTVKNRNKIKSSNRPLTNKLSDFNLHLSAKIRPIIATSVYANRCLWNLNKTKLLKNIWDSLCKYIIAWHNESIALLGSMRKIMFIPAGFGVCVCAFCLTKRTALFSTTFVYVLSFWECECPFNNNRNNACTLIQYFR